MTALDFGCKGKDKKYSHNILLAKYKILYPFIRYPTKSLYICIRILQDSDSSAVGSVLRSGRRGREFESPLSDKMGNLTSELQWFAMRVTYRRELKVQDMLHEAQVETFIPMKIVKKKCFGRVKVMKAPAISSLIFVHTTKDFIQEFKKEVPYLQYMITRESDRSYPTIVPEKQMQDFIGVCGSEDERLLFMDPSTLKLNPGQRVRVLAGPCAGMIGTFQRVKGAREKRFIISVPGVIAVITASVLPSQVMLLKDDE